MLFLVFHLCSILYLLSFKPASCHCDTVSPIFLLINLLVPVASEIPPKFSSCWGEFGWTLMWWTVWYAVFQLEPWHQFSCLQLQVLYTGSSYLEHTVSCMPELPWHCLRGTLRTTISNSRSRQILILFWHFLVMSAFIRQWKTHLWLKKKIEFKNFPPLHLMSWHPHWGRLVAAVSKRMAV